MPVCFGSYTSPGLAGTWFAPSCFGECDVVVTDDPCTVFCDSIQCQDAVVECAALVADDCTLNGDPPVPPDDPNNPVPEQHRFHNSFQECTVECPDGTTFTYRVQAGEVASYTKADANAKAYGLACKRARQRKVCFTTDATLTSTCVNEFMSLLIDATGGREPYVFTLESGALPTGTEMNPEGNIFGTPTVGGTYAFVIRVTDAVGSFQLKTFSLGVIRITTASPLPNATMVSDEAGTSVFSFLSLTSLHLMALHTPAGLPSLSSNG